MNTLHSRLIWLVPVALFFLIAPFTPWIDLTLSRMSYSPVTGSFRSGPWLDFMYEWGLIPGKLMIAGSLIILIISYPVKRYRRMRTPALYLALTLAIGAGFITHALLKDHWGRPRPKQVVEFGGTQEYRPMWKPDFSRKAQKFKSFPCGHCTMGFAFFAFYFLGKRQGKRWISLFGVAIALILGTGLGVTRVMQGGHFFSDVIATALIMWMTAWVFDRILYEDGDIVV